ncbi:MAG: lactate utilization protein [Candidatus Latescibacteria bacterium]|jgi:L-lactate dehydrogenase complex protein LldG|nr:lactate utilization protein [Candidatus Latescibacterota bacterium]
MAENAVERFKTKYESLAGVVHQARSCSEAIDLMMGVVRDAAANRVALGPLADPVAKEAVRACGEAGVQVVAPPYRRDALPAAIDAAQVGITASKFAIVETGTLVELCTDDSHRLASTLPGTHIGLVLEEDLVEGLSDAASLIRDFYESNPRHATATFISGPSRTADIEMRLTLGVHGPASAHVVICSGWS